MPLPRAIRSTLCVLLLAGMAGAPAPPTPARSASAR